MSWRIFGVFVMLLGICFFVTGIVVELRIEERLGKGAWRALAEISEAEAVERYRQLSTELVVAGPVVFFLGLLIFHVSRRRRRGGRRPPEA